MMCTVLSSTDCAHLPTTRNVPSEASVHRCAGVPLQSKTWMWLSSDGTPPLRSRHRDPSAPIVPVRSVTGGGDTAGARGARAAPAAGGVVAPGAADPADLDGGRDAGTRPAVARPR